MEKKKGFYLEKGLNAEIYDDLHRIEGQPYDGDIDFYLKHAALVGGPVLELGCGTGRVAWEIAKAGYETVGLDLSLAMLEIAKSKEGSFSDDVRKRMNFVVGNMIEFKLQREFSLIIIPFRAWQAVISPDDQRRSLNSIRKHLRDGGRFILDIFDPRYDMCLPGEQDRSMHNRVVRNQHTGLDVEVKIVYHLNDPVNQVLRETWKFIERNKSGEIVREEEEELLMRWTFRWEIRYLLELTGLRVLNEYSDFKSSPPEYGKGQILDIEKS